MHTKLSCNVVRVYKHCDWSVVVVYKHCYWSVVSVYKHCDWSVVRVYKHWDWSVVRVELCSRSAPTACGRCGRSALAVFKKRPEHSGRMQPKRFSGCIRPERSGCMRTERSGQCTDMSVPGLFILFSTNSNELNIFSLIKTLYTSHLMQIPIFIRSCSLMFPGRLVCPSTDGLSIRVPPEPDLPLHIFKKY